MSPPYLVISWPQASDAAVAAVAAMAEGLGERGWSPGLQQPGLQLWRRVDRPAPVRWCAATQSVIVGHRLDRRSRETLVAGYHPADGSVAERANRLCCDGWGAYVALLQDPDDGRWWAFRDPSGAVEAFSWMVGPLQILASGLGGLPHGVRPTRLGLDWIVIADFLRRPASLVGRTGLDGLEALAPGDLQPVGAPRSQAVAIWRPRDWLPKPRTTDPAWPEALAETVQAAIAGLVGPYSRVVTEVSGGLDSAIVSAGVARAGLSSRVAAALHYSGDGAESDERLWARHLCEHWALPLVSTPFSSTPFDPAADFCALARGARPPYAALDAARDADTAERLRACGAQALVTGKGGDAVFFQMPTVAVLADLWADQGAAALGHPQNAAIARWLRRSIWSVWREAMEPERTGQAAVGEFAGWALGEIPTGAPHPWLEDLDTAPRGKRIQIQALVGCHNSLGASRRSDAADLVQPLMAQPVMELCLSIPSWELVRGGRDRGLARDAFASWLPQSVAARRTKGALTSIYSRRAAASLEALRSHLLDGVLAGAGLLDRRQMEAALDADQLIRRADGLDLLLAAAVESWVRHWQSRIPDAPEAGRFQA